MFVSKSRREIEVRAILSGIDLYGSCWWMYMGRGTHSHCGLGKIDAKPSIVETINYLSVW